MRQFIALVALGGMMSLVGCRHVGGGCDCEHAINPAYVNAPVAKADCATGSCGGAAPVAPVVTPAGQPVQPVVTSPARSTMHSTSYQRMPR